MSEAKTYEFTCAECQEEIIANFEVGEIEETGTIICEECEAEFELVYDAATGTATMGDLFLEDDDDEGEDDEPDDEGDEDDDEPED